MHKLRFISKMTSVSSGALHLLSTLSWTRVLGDMQTFAWSGRFFSQIAYVFSCPGAELWYLVSLFVTPGNGTLEVFVSHRPVSHRPSHVWMDYEFGAASPPLRSSRPLDKDET